MSRSHRVGLPKRTSKRSLGAVAFAVCALLGSTAARADDVVVATILNVSDLHGALEPILPPYGVGDRAPERFGGAAYLKAYFDREASLAPTEPFIVTAGDAVGATQPLSGLADDHPTIDIMNRLGFDADTLGNHNFDRGVEHMRELARRAEFPYVVSNLVDTATGAAPSWVKRWVVWDVRGVKVGVTGVINDDAPVLVKDGGFGTLEVRPMADSINAAAAEMEAVGVRTVVVLAHVGITVGAGSNVADGPLTTLANKLRGIDVLIGDHTNLQWNGYVRDADNEPLLVTENFSQGLGYTAIRVTIDRATGEAVSATATTHLASVRGVEPDPEIAARVKTYRDAVEPRLQELVGYSSVSIPQTLPGSESNQGNLLTDAMRWGTGADFAVANSGGFRAALTKPDDREPDGRFLIRRGYILSTLPFGNAIATVTITGAELKTILENGVSRQPQPDGRFIQVSGLRFEYRVLALPGSRVVAGSVRRPDGTPVDLGASSRYKVALVDFMALGGDGYPNFKGRFGVGDQMDEVVADYIASVGTVSPEGPVPPATVPKTRIFETL